MNVHSVVALNKEPIKIMELKRVRPGRDFPMGELQGGRLVSPSDNDMRSQLVTTCGKDASWHVLENNEADKRLLIPYNHESKHIDSLIEAFQCRSSRQHSIMRSCTWEYRGKRHGGPAASSPQFNGLTVKLTPRTLGE
jgi:hypothetical protein